MLIVRNSNVFGFWTSTVFLICQINEWQFQISIFKLVLDGQTIPLHWPINSLNLVDSQQLVGQLMAATFKWPLQKMISCPTSTGTRQLQSMCLQLQDRTWLFITLTQANLDDFMTPECYGKAFSGTRWNRVHDLSLKQCWLQTLDTHFVIGLSLPSLVIKW